MLVNMHFNWQRCLTRKRLAVKSYYNKKCEYVPLGKELKAQIEIGKKKNQGLDKGFTSNKDNENVNEPLNKDEKKKYNRLRFYSNSDDKKLDSLSFK